MEILRRRNARGSEPSYVMEPGDIFRGPDGEVLIGHVNERGGSCSCCSEDAPVVYGELATGYTFIRNIFKEEK